MSRGYDAIVVGAGPNGLAAAITLQRHGLSVCLLEAKSSIGGGMRTQELTLPGFKHDVCSAVHPLLMSSPFFQSLPLKQYGLEFIQPSLPLAHPLEGEEAAFLSKSLEDTVESLGIDGQRYLAWIQPLIRDWEGLAAGVLNPLDLSPRNLFRLSKFAIHSLRSAESIAGSFKTGKAKGVWAGLAGHSMLPFKELMAGTTGLILAATAHTVGWPIVKGGSGTIAQAMGAYFQDLGGVIQTDFEVQDMHALPAWKALLFDLGPQQILQIGGNHFNSHYSRALRKYRYGMGVFKMDWALHEPVPFKASVCQAAGTLHLGNAYAEIANAEQITAMGKVAKKPFVLFSQPSVFDSSRAPKGKHVAWGYCHVPHGACVNMQEAIEEQVERFAPGFKDCILARHSYNAQEMQAYNPNYIGGDINGGVLDLRQLFFRPTPSLSPYRTPAKGIYICSASTPPGGGVHGMCGYNAARQVIKEVFHLPI